jgi:hypothetical protein
MENQMMIMMVIGMVNQMIEVMLLFLIKYNKNKYKNAHNKKTRTTKK